ncbi:MAG: pseudaminic acid synthase [Candidatus Paracaedibacter sp.]
MKQININDRIIGDGAAPYIVAELSGNHNGSIERAKAIITEAKKCGADAIKIQTFKPDSITLPSNREEFMITHGLWKGFNLYNLYQETCVPYEWHQELFLHAKETDITLFSTPFSEKDVEFLESLDVCAYKIASNEFTHYPLIKEVLKTNKPIILSTGTATWEEIENTANFLEKHSCKNYIILYCVSAYPTPVEELNLFTIRELKSRLGCLVGLSDHSMGIIAPVVSVSLGACFIEKHFTLDRTDGGSDSSFSLEPAELKALCESVLVAYQSLGEPFFGYKSCEKKSPIFKRHYYSIAGIKEGDILSLDNVAAVRSPTGISSRDFEKVIGQRAAKDILKHEPIQWNDIDA